MDPSTKFVEAVTKLGLRLRAEYLRQGLRLRSQPPQPPPQITYCRDCDVPEGMDW